MKRNGENSIPDIEIVVYFSDRNLIYIINAQVASLDMIKGLDTLEFKICSMFMFQIGFPCGIGYIYFIKKWVEDLTTNEWSRIIVSSIFFCEKAPNLNNFWLTITLLEKQLCYECLVLFVTVKY